MTAAEDRAQLIARILPSNPARDRAHEVTRRRRWSRELDALCGIEAAAPDGADRYASGALTWQQREHAGRRSA